MPDYGDILQFLAQNPPQHEAERRLHASLLELLAQCLRAEEREAGEFPEDAPAARGETLAETIAREHFNRVHFN
jgi:hypothetical protein